ncbi:DASH complex subunit DAD1 [Cryptococcus wingfieldii CBS 7118]|uniref:DASH complex subunit DAD1 n=1 Tax=Cryptococcus wingfieldii CBS 7118 TaxID=1295528 RepID=A0A1E3J4S4_9TREE|nr:DASH complex subunit DAD1 [Cryptococcus wingfieldii CBS 7118]ODN95852.1 DASH complex subunit DAD1 [Cryptococcus wingfieldii CBS 7118]
MSLSRPSTAYDLSTPQESLFDRERERLIEEISTNFEELMGNMNNLNRTLEQVYGVGREFTTVSALWGRFSSLIKEQQTELAASADVGVPGTGGANFAASTTNNPSKS